MKSPLVVTTLVLLVVTSPHPAHAQPNPEAIKAEGPKITVNGYDRVRLLSALNYDLDASQVTDNSVLFADMRAWVGLEAAWERMKLVVSTDIAGTDFDEGSVMGFDNPTRQRPVSVMLRHLYLDYTVPELGIGATLGRQPARLGFGIVSAINRDSARVTKHLGELGILGKSSLAVVAVRAGKGASLWPDHIPAPALVTPAPGVSGGRQGVPVTNDPDGSWRDLSTYVLAYNTTPLGSRLQAFFAQQIDSTQAGQFPSKRFVDLNGDVNVGPLKLGYEGVWLTGVGPTATTGANAGKRPDLRSYALFGKAIYPLADLEIGFNLGQGGGDNDPTDNTNTGFQSLFIDEQSFAFNHLFGDDLHGFDGADASVGRGAGLNNVTFLQPNVTWRINPDLTAHASYTHHLATVPQKLGSGVLGTTATSATTTSHDIGAEADARLSWRVGATTLYGAASTFVPGAVFARPGLANAAHKVELGTEVRF